MPEKLNLPNGTSSEGLTMSNLSSCHDDRSFLIHGKLNDEQYNQLPFSPVDEATGVPLILHPEGYSRDSRRFADDKHHPWHPKNHPLVKSGTLGGEALRASRIQTIKYDMHHYDYHHNFYGPELPTNNAARFKLIVLTAAGYIPENALSFDRRSTPSTKVINSEDRIKLWKGNRIRVDKPGIIRDFLKEYSLNQDLSNIRESTIDEFLFTKDPFKRLELGNALLAESVLKATEPIKQLYKNAYESELLPPRRTKKVTKFVFDSLNIVYHRASLIDELGRRILQSAA